MNFIILILAGEYTVRVLRYFWAEDAKPARRASAVAALRFTMPYEARLQTRRALKVRVFLGVRAIFAIIRLAGFSLAVGALTGFAMSTKLPMTGAVIAGVLAALYVFVGFSLLRAQERRRLARCRAPERDRC